jgi:UDP-N-acetylmuramoylalanine--D-glutamate ligase
MTPQPSFTVAGKRVVVVGAARSGVAAAQLLARRGASVVLTDVRPQVEGEEGLRKAGVELELGGHRRETLARADLIVLSPGVPPAQPAVAEARAAGVAVIGELELASRWLRGRIVAITGTKGKSTTTTLAGRMLQEGGHHVLVGGNIGNALSEQVDRSTDKTIHVIEASSFQLESTETFHPWIAVLLNFSPDHLDRHADIVEYAAAKARVFVNQLASDWAVLNADDAASAALVHDARSRRLYFSLDRELAEGVGVSEDAIVRRRTGEDEVLVPLSAVKLIGRHLLSDVLAAAAVASLAGVPGEAMTRAVEGFAGLEHALEPLPAFGDVEFVNDSKATNIESALRAIESFDNGLVVIIGGRYKGGDFGDLRDALIRRDAQVVAIGEAAPLIHTALEPVIRVHDAGRDMGKAVRVAFSVASPGATVLLAPACSSFDMFDNYAERGRVFKQEVMKLREDWYVTDEQ